MCVQTRLLVVLLKQQLPLQAPDSRSVLMFYSLPDIIPEDNWVFFWESTGAFSGEADTLTTKLFKPVTSPLKEVVALKLLSAV